MREDERAGVETTIATWFEAFVAEFVARRPGARFEFEESAEDGRIRRAVAFWEPRTGRAGTS